MENTREAAAAARGPTPASVTGTGTVGDAEGSSLPGVAVVIALQRLVGNAAVARMVAATPAIQRQPQTAAPPQPATPQTTTPQPEATAPQATTPQTTAQPQATAGAQLPATRVANDAPAAVVGRVVTAATALVGTATSADMWPLIRDQFAEPRARPRRRMREGSPLAPLSTELFSAATVAELRALGPAGRRTALGQIFNALAPAMATPAAGETTVPLDAEVAAEEARVDARIRNNADGGWRGVRQGILAAFGVFEVGVQAAIDRANVYYRQLVPSRLFGRAGSLVHPVMQERLDLASAQLATATGAERTDIERSIGTPGGFYIRPNANNPSVLSFHSFGWAIDLSATANPNVGNDSSPMAVVGAVSGHADPLGAETEGLSAADAARVAEELRATSRDYVAAMRDDASLSAALRRIANRARATAALPELGGDGADILAAAGTGAPISSAAVLGVIAAGAPSPTPPPLSVAAGTILTAVRAYRASFGRGGRRVGASVTATAGSVAAHGFMDLNPRLVGALTGTNAGNLNWLGTSSVHDYMHFELPAALRRNLLTAPVAAPATGAGDVHPAAGGQPIQAPSPTAAGQAPGGGAAGGAAASTGAAPTTPPAAAPASGGG